MEALFSGNLTLITFFPLIGIFFILFFSVLFEESDYHVKIGALIVSVIEFLISIPLFTNFKNSFPGIQFEQKVQWMTDLGVSYHVGIDGISVLLVLLTTFIIPITILGTWEFNRKGDESVFMFDSPAGNSTDRYLCSP